MSSGENNKPFPPWAAGLVAAAVTFLATMIVSIACVASGVDSKDVPAFVVLVAMLGVGILAYCFKRRIDKDAVDRAVADGMISRLSVANGDLQVTCSRQHEKITELKATRDRLLAEIETHRRIAEASSTVDLISLETIEELGVIANSLHILRKGRSSITSADAGSVQDRAVIALILHLARCVPVEREQMRHLGPIGEMWTTATLDSFFASCRFPLPDILKQLATKKNVEFVAAMRQLPPDIELYLSRLTLTHPAEQPKEPAAAS